MNIVVLPLADAGGKGEIEGDEQGWNGSPSGAPFRADARKGE